MISSNTRANVGELARQLPLLPGRESTLVVAISFWLVLVQISIAASQIVLTAAVILWVYQLVAGKLELVKLPIDLPLGLFVLFSLASAFYSFDPGSSLAGTKKLVLLVIPYLTVSAVRRISTLETLILLLIAVADLSALVSLWQYFFGELGDLNHRIRGFMGHYMTFSGLLMGVGVLTLAELLYRGKRFVFLAGSLSLIFTALILTLTRSAWVGVLFAIIMLLTLRDRRLLLTVPALALAVAVLVPREVETRLLSFVQMDRSSHDRLFMLRSGARMTANHPWFGVGPNMVRPLYPIYMIEGAPQQENVHLHNNVMQIAAERGLPCLVAWLWLMASLLLWTVRAFRRTNAASGERALAAGALGVLVASLTAGLFEYNFGDSEFLMFFLFVMTFPFLLERRRRGTAQP